MVEILECVGDLRSCPCGSRKVGSGDEVDSSRALAGSGETGGKRKSGVARVRPLDVPEVAGDETPPVLLCDRFRPTGGLLDVERSGEEVERTMGGWLSTVASVGETAGISMFGTPRFDLTSR